MSGYSLTSALNIANWDTAFGWGDHSLAGYLSAEAQTLTDVTALGNTTSNDITVNGLTVSTNEATFNGDVRIGSALFMTDFAPDSGRNLISIGQNGGQAYTTTDNSANWNTAVGWGDHSTQGYLTAYVETDPIYTASVAFNIDAQNITDLGNLSGTNSGDDATNSQYSGLDAAKANLSGATFTGAISATNLSGSNTGDQTLSSLGAVASNAAITAGTNTKITYDAKGLVTAGEAATTADIAASADKNYVTDAQQTVIGNTSGTNTGDQTLSISGNDLTISGTGGNTVTIPSSGVSSESYGNIHLTSLPATTTSIATGVKLTGTTAEIITGKNFTATDNKLQYTGTATKVFTVIIYGFFQENST